MTFQRGLVSSCIESHLQGTGKNASQSNPLGISLYEFVSITVYAIPTPRVSVPDPADASDLTQDVRTAKSKLPSDLQKLVAWPV